MAKVYVHVGPFKTGSSAIQQFVFSHERELLECGVYIPEAGRLGPQSPHHHLAWEIAGSEKFKPELGGWASLLSEISNRQQVLISSEAFSEKPEHYSEVVRLLGAAGHTLITVFVVRNPLEIINSAYTQRVKTFRLALAFDDYFPRAMRERRYNYLQFYRQFFSDPARTVLLPFHRKQLIEKFLRVLGADLTTFNGAFEGGVNESPFAHEVEAIRLSVDFLRMSGISPQKTLSILNSLRADSLWRDPFWGFSEHQFQLGQARFRDSMEDLFVALGQDPGLPTLENRKRTLFTTEVLAPEQAKIFTEYCERFRLEVARFRGVAPERIPPLSI